jgi:hypothetical protein
MRIADSKVLSKYFEKTTSGNYDFYRCFDCGRIITRQREREVFNMLDNERFLRICQCGSMKYSPSWPAYFEWLLPRVAYYVYKLVLVRGVAAWADGRFPTLVRKIEDLVRDEWEESTLTEVTHVG